MVLKCFKPTKQLSFHKSCPSPGPFFLPLTSVAACPGSQPVAKFEVSAAASVLPMALERPADSGGSAPSSFRGHAKESFDAFHQVLGKWKVTIFAGIIHSFLVLE